MNVVKETLIKTDNTRLNRLTLEPIKRPLIKKINTVTSTIRIIGLTNVISHTHFHYVNFVRLFYNPQQLLHSLLEL